MKNNKGHDEMERQAARDYAESLRKVAKVIDANMEGVGRCAAALMGRAKIVEAAAAHIAAGMLRAAALAVMEAADTIESGVNEQAKIDAKSASSHMNN